MLLFMYLIKGQSGYDARIRHALKKLGVFVFLLDDDDTAGKIIGNNNKEQQNDADAEKGTKERDLAARFA